MTGPTDGYDRLCRSLQQEILESLDFAGIANRSRDDLAQRLRATLRERIASRGYDLNDHEKARLAEDVVDHLLGLGPLEPLLRDPDISDILVNGPDRVWVERHGRLQRTDVHFRDEPHLMQVIDRIVSATGRRIDETVPMVDARMSDGSRFNAIISPLALEGPYVSIRRFRPVPITDDELVRLGSMPRPMMDVLRGAVRARLNVIVSGGTGSGKTTLLNVLSSFIPHDERVVTIEDSAELQLQQPHVVRLETRPPNLEGRGEVTPRDLVRNALRMRPDRIILGEIRGAEAIDLLTAMNTGHDGSLATVHANNPRDALGRFETMVGIAMPNMADRSIRETIARAVDLIVQLDRLPDGSRRVLAITEVTGMEGSVVSTQDLFIFEQSTIDGQGRVRGKFRSTGLRPRFSPRLHANGIELPSDTFRFVQEV
jgi:pilus assembly protein CpaF